MNPTKICPTCKIEKPIEDFIRPSLWRCRKCENDALRERRRKRIEARPPKPIRSSKTCTICGEDLPLSNFYWANRAKSIFSSYCKKCQIKMGNAARLRFGRKREKCTRLRTTVDWFNRTLREQDERCAICREVETHPCKKGGATRSLAIDHDHVTHQVRGLLCFRCNTSIHMIEKHGFEWAESAVKYLAKYKN